MNFKSTGFKDYKASRFLLQNDFFAQGITLASSSVEKYIKSILISNDIKKPVHLDKLEQLKKKFKEIGNNRIESIDPVFLDILGTAYKLRYYDNFKEKVSFGFLVNQIIVELDFTIKLLDSAIVIADDKTSEVVKSDYVKSIEGSDEVICANNYLVTGESKKSVMQKPGKGYFLMIDEIGYETELQGGELSQVEYDGGILKVADISFGKSTDPPFEFRV